MSLPVRSTHVQSDEMGCFFCFGAHAGQRPIPSGLELILAVSAGYDYTCTIATDGSLLCFGENEHGQCNIPDDPGPFVDVAAGTFHTCAIRADGRLVCFGRNDGGQCDVPDDLGAVVAVEVGLAHTCAVTVDGCISCFGSNKWTQCDVPSMLNPRKSIVMSGSLKIQSTELAIVPLPSDAV